MVLDQKHRHAELSVHTPQQSGHDIDLFMADATGGLVEKEEARFRNERPRQLDPFLSAERQRGDGVAREAHKAHEVEHLQRAGS